jgi:hypothetical protein
MSTIPSGQSFVKEFRFFSDSRFVTVVFEDDATIEFHGEENYHKARVATAHGRQEEQTTLELVDQEGKTVAMVVKKDVVIEAFDA